MVDPQPVRRRIIGVSGPARPTAFLPRAAAKAEDKPMKRSGISTLCGAIVLGTISTAAMAAADSGRGVGSAASGPMFDLPDGMSVSQQETHISLYAMRQIGREPCRDKGCQYVSIPVVAVSLEKKVQTTQSTQRIKI